MAGLIGKVGLQDCTCQIPNGYYNETRNRVKGLEGYKAGDVLKEFVDNLKDEDEYKDMEDIKNMFNDVGSLWRVDFEEVAESFQEE